ncbi:hypothetical protein SAMD00019534_033410 [Acytostelium subglobosum LB1]|uniref:hypothetical protein n=1 Tax=Acytostelium subglobosum LB1 TaxID=1410327 RepID=UPI000644DB65|nr:hypothetical protein SAMD00019534_033410 [Acytostelium subglobosum LB1]GAM20166.1 hypothetical protein SAMD00019534_033410 [Acytostelium subglobosum LB1]|eukprot:XP_012759687.1 hypothetical protein SAMD00019534_033410 [Acytostelium subglobosum LB1]
MVHPSLPGHYFLYGCYPDTTFQFNDTSSRFAKYANYTVTEVSSEDFINEITTKGTMQAFMDMTTLEMDLKERGEKTIDTSSDCCYSINSKNFNKTFRIRRVSISREIQVRDEEVILRRHQFIPIPVNRPIFVKTDDIEHQPFGFRLDYDLLISEHPEMPFKDKVTGKLLLPDGHVFLYNQLYEGDEEDDYRFISKHCQFNDDNDNDNDISQLVDNFGSDFLCGKTTYTDSRAKCSGIQSANSNIVSYSKAFGRIQRSLIGYPFIFAYPKIVKIRNTFIRNFLKLSPSRQAHLAIYSHDEELTPPTIDNKSAHACAYNMLIVRPQLRSMKRPIKVPPLVQAIRDKPDMAAHYPQYELDSNPRIPMTLDTILVLADNIDLLFPYVELHFDEPFPTPLDIMLRYSRSSRCIENYFENYEHYFEYNPAAKPLWSLAHNVMVPIKKDFGSS